MNSPVRHAVKLDARDSIHLDTCLFGVLYEPTELAVHASRLVDPEMEHASAAALEALHDGITAFELVCHG
jgi:hypothetical protein